MFGTFSSLTWPRSDARRRVLSLGSLLGAAAVLLLSNESVVIGAPLYVADRSAGPKWEQPGAILRIDLESSEYRVFAHEGLIQKPVGITRGLDLALYVLQSSPGEPAQFSIVRIDPVTGAQSLVTQGGLLQASHQIATGPTGDLFVSDGQALDDRGAIIRVDPVSGAQSFVTMGGFVELPTDLSFTPSGQLLVVDVRGTRDHVIRVDPTSGDQTLITTDDFRNPLREALAIAATDDVAYVCDYPAFRCRVYRVHLGTGAVSLVAELDEDDAPSDILIEESGTLLVLVRRGFGIGVIVRVDPDDGTHSTAAVFDIAEVPLAMVFGPDIPTTARVPSWGALKARYRGK